MKSVNFGVFGSLLFYLTYILYFMLFLHNDDTIL